MDISILQLIEGAKQAKGTAVIIDVFRAFSLEAYLFGRGAEKILAVGTEDTAYRLKERQPEYILIGERGGKKLPGFDFGNSPSQTEGFDFTGKTVIHTTSAGTQGIVNAAGADEIFTGSLVNARAVAEAVRRRNPKTVSLVCMGEGGVREAYEDTLCGEYIRSILRNEPFDMAAGLAELRNRPSGRKFFDPANREIFPNPDYFLCTQVDRFDFALQVRRVSNDIFEVNRI